MNKFLIDHSNPVGSPEVAFSDIGYTEAEPSESEVLHVHMYAALAAAVLVLLVWLI
ncbi:hypothetical protein [Bacterioplanoides sp.]|uniref:hypothetical protein n=1 Tax=Bacterioplanoides sp. TaxID=2066072 RepID=UPI003B5C5B72